MICPVMLSQPDATAARTFFRPERVTNVGVGNNERSGQGTGASQPVGAAMGTVIG